MQLDIGVSVIDREGNQSPNQNQNPKEEMTVKETGAKRIPPGGVDTEMEVGTVRGRMMNIQAEGWRTGGGGMKMKKETATEEMTEVMDGGREEVKEEEVETGRMEGDIRDSLRGQEAGHRQGKKGKSEVRRSKMQLIHQYSLCIAFF